jgi:simple sugar transport system permease protein
LMATKTMTPVATDERVAQGGIARGIFRRVEVGALIGAVVIWVLFALVAPENWITITGLSRILDEATTLGIMGVAVSLLMIGGEFDLSAGVMTGTTALIAGLLSVRAGWDIWPSMLAALVFAALVGFVNGWMVVKTRLPSFIVTLATFFILRGANVGITRLVTERIVVEGIDKAVNFYNARLVFDTEFKFLGATFRTSMFWWIGLMLLAAWVLQRTRFGNWIFAVGGDAQSARNLGVPSDRVKIALFMTTAMAGWLVGMMNVVRLRSAVASQGIGEEFVYIICAVIGGCLLTGGFGSAIGAGIGAIIFGMARVGIVFAGWDTDWFYTFLGVMLLVAVLVNDNTRRRAEAMRIAAAKVRTEEEKENA